MPLQPEDSLRQAESALSVVGQVGSAHPSLQTPGHQIALTTAVVREIGPHGPVCARSLWNQDLVQPGGPV